MFHSTLALFDRYYRHFDAANVASFNRDLACEVRARLQQLTFILKRVRELERAAEDAIARGNAAVAAHFRDLDERNLDYETEPPPDGSGVTRAEASLCHRASFEMRLLTEAFYYFAGRIRTILRNVKAPLPGLTNFECVGVRNTRNKLLEHPEGADSQVFAHSFSWGGKDGPVIKAVRYDGQTRAFPDRGLYENAREFSSALNKTLDAALRDA